MSPPAGNFGIFAVMVYAQQIHSSFRKVKHGGDIVRIAVVQPHLSCVGTIAVVFDRKVSLVNLRFGLREFQFGAGQVLAKAIMHVAAVLSNMHLLAVGGLAIEQGVSGGRDGSAGEQECGECGD